jgi:hypothetical protein
MSTTHQIARGAAFMALALAMSIGAATAPAQAAPYLNVTCNITYHPVDGTDLDNDGAYDLYVIDAQGVVTMSPAAARDAISHGLTIQLRYWGDDPSDDDLLVGPVKPQTVFADADGLHYKHSQQISRSLLDEDGNLDIVTNSERDEIYVGARFVDPDGKTLSLVESNRIYKDFYDPW